MTAYDTAQARLQDARRRGDRRDIHAAIEESRRLMTALLRREVEQRRGRPMWRKWWRRA